MFPPVYATLAADAAVRQLLTGADGKLRLFPFGEAPQHYAKAYVAWGVVYGSPDHSLSCIPNTDLFGVQFDVYGEKADEVHAVAAAIRDALEATMTAILVRYSGQTKEPAAGNERMFHYSFDVEWRVYRPTVT